MMPSPVPPSAWAANGVCMLSMLIWAMGLPAAGLLLGTVPPLPLTAARMVTAACCLLPFWLLLEGADALRKAPWWRGIGLGGSTIGLGAFLMVVGQSMTDAVTVAIISASMPVVGIAIEVLLDGRKLSRGLVIGVALSLVGGVMALDGGNQRLALGLGALMSFAAILVYTLGSRLTVTSFPDLSPLGRTTVTLAGAAVATTVAACAAALAGAAPPQWAALGWRELGALAIFAIGGMAISQVLWIRSVGHLGIALSSLHINATPFYVMLILFALGGAWNWTQAAAALVVGVGVFIAQGVFVKAPTEPASERQ